MPKKTLAILVLALVTPSVALAAKPQTHTSRSKAAPQVMYVLKGTLWNYTAASSTADGSITIKVTHSNYHARALVGQQLTLAVSAKTTITLDNGATTINNGASGIVKFRALLKASNTTLLAAFGTHGVTAAQVIDRPGHHDFRLIPPTK